MLFNEETFQRDKEEGRKEEKKSILQIFKSWAQFSFPGLQEMKISILRVKTPVEF